MRLKQLVHWVTLSACGSLALAGGNPCPGIAFDEDSQFIELLGLPLSVTAGDIDLDGDLDLLVGSSHLGDPENWLLINLGNGVFDVPVELPADNRTSVNRLVDVNGDSYPDLVGSSWNGVVFMLNDGSGGFAGPDYYDTRSGHGEIEIVDLNGDAHLDIVTTSEQQDGVSVLLGDGAGGFAPEIFTGGLDGAVGLGIGDFDSDGIPDAFVTLDIQDKVAVLFGDGVGGFRLGYMMDGGNFPISAQVADLNQDGHSDVVVRQLIGPGIHIHLGDGSGQFSAPQTIAVEGGITLWTDCIGLGDLDRDGNTDIVSGTILEGATVLLGRDDGSFLPVRRYGGQGPGVSGVVVADLDGDGLEDVAATQPYLPAGLRIVFNECDAMCTAADLATPRGEQDLRDVTTFVGYFVGGNAIADLNRDDLLDLADIVTFADEYRDNCVGGGTSD